MHEYWLYPTDIDTLQLLLGATCSAFNDSGDKVSSVFVEETSTHRAGYRFAFPAAEWPNGHGCTFVVTHPDYYTDMQKGVLYLLSDGTARLETDDIRLLKRAVIAPPPPPPTPGKVPGCINSRLSDPKAYFLHVLNEQAKTLGLPPVTYGSRADNYEQMLRGTFPAGPNPNKRADTGVHYGITQQIGVSGRIAGRLFLPTMAADDLGYYTLPVSILGDVGRPGGLDGLKWIWEPWADWRQPYAAPCF